MSNRLGQLDVLRGIACIVVLIAHLRTVPQFSSVPESAGAAGVGLFFALSGFLITRGLLTGVDLFRFYNRRAARILPIYYLVLILTALFWTGQEIYWAADFTMNLRLTSDVQDYYRPSNDLNSTPPLAHFWSLCVEEHFYWVWPWVVAVLPRRWLWSVPASIIVGTIPATAWMGSQLESDGLWPWQIEGLLGRATSFQLVAICLGALSAIYETWLIEKVLVGRTRVPRSLVVAGLMLLLSACLRPLITVCFQRRGMLEAAATTHLHLNCGALFLVFWSCPAIARLKWLAWVGRVSYGLYLYHLPIYAIFGLLRQNEASNFPMALTALSLNFLLAAISYRYLEEPLIKAARDGCSNLRKMKWLCWIGPTLTMATFGLFATDLFLTHQAEAKIVAPLKQVNPDEIRTIVVGSSHAHHAFACPVFYESAYNFGFNNGDLWYETRVVRKSIEEFPNLKRVIFFVSVMTFRQAICIHAPLAEDWHYKSWGIRARRDTGDRKYRTKILNQELAMFSEMRQKGAHADEPSRGWSPMSHRPEELTIRNAELCAEVHTVSDTPLKQHNIEILVEVIEECKSRGIECDLVMAPTHQLYRNALASDYVAETTEIAREIARKTGVRLFDHRADELFVDEDFGDVVHLSEIGALKFMRILEAELLQQ